MFRIFLYVFFAYSPWHDAYTLGQRGAVSLLGYSFSTLSWAGLANIFWILGWLFFLGRSFLQAKLKFEIPEKRVVLWVMLFWFYCLVNTREIRGPSVNFILNWTLWSFFFVALIAANSALRNEISRHLKSLIFTFGISYFLALILPVLIPLNDPWVPYSPGYVRYGGWVGDGQVLGLTGAVLLCWALVFVAKTGGYLKKTDFVLVAAFSFLGLLGIFLNIYRLGWLIATVMVMAMAWGVFQGKIKLKSLKGLSAFLLVLCLIIPVTPRFLNKTFTSAWSDPEKVSSILNASQVDSAARTESLLNTNGRTFLYKMLFEYWREAPFFGHGTGSIQALLQQKQKHGYFQGVAQANSDYLRILVEQGLIGFALWVLLFGMIIFNLKTYLQRAIVFTFCVGLSTDALMIMPALGYGHFFLMLLIGNRLFNFSESSTNLKVGENVLIHESRI